ncbi:hypothetical protein R3I94_002902 [Phoxinus phoxinus]|uniref:Uncharacterized protein n=1 Tax=Phoxinus phoxinus TaxID=58324 RepID=A0AAN9DFU7_9TELE
MSAVQVEPLCPSVSCSTEDLGAFIDPLFITSTLIKRPRMENSADEIKNTSSGTIKDSTKFDSTYEPDITQEDSQTACQPLYSASKYIVYEDNLLHLFRKCPTCMHTCTVNKFVIWNLCVNHTDMFSLSPQNPLEQPAVHQEYPSWLSALVSSSSFHWVIIHTSSLSSAP